jgi:hypothetical protein
VIGVTQRAAQDRREAPGVPRAKAAVPPHGAASVESAVRGRTVAPTASAGTGPTVIGGTVLTGPSGPTGTVRSGTAESDATVPSVGARRRSGATRAAAARTAVTERPALVGARGSAAPTGSGAASGEGTPRERARAVTVRSVTTGAPSRGTPWARRSPRT